MEALLWLEKIYENKIFLLVVGALCAWIGVLIVKKILHNFFKRTNFLDEKKEQTIESIAGSFVKYAAVFGYIIFAFAIFGVELGSLMAGAGVLGVVLGFGAQSLIRDILAGVFFYYEKQIHKGDFISINSKYTGTVEEVGIRSLKVREFSGKLLSISNGEIKELQNYNMRRMRVIERIVASFREDPDRVFQVLEEACVELNKNFSHFLKLDEEGKPIESFKIYGLSSLNSNYRGFEYTVVGLVDDTYYWEAHNQTRRVLAKKIYEHNIQMPEENLLLQSKEREYYS